MLFNSFEYILLFLPITITMFFFLHRSRLSVPARAWLMTCSFFFYGWWKLSYLLIIIASIVINYLVGRSFAAPDEDGCHRPADRRRLIVGITFNLGLLGYYKYTDFAIANMDRFFGVQIEPLNLVLPLAISFFTFQQIAYLVDSYRNETHEYDFLSYCLFVTFFPQLIAGPIVHHKEMMPQFQSQKNFSIDYQNLATGLFVFGMGLFKKVILADTLAVHVNAGYSTIASLSVIEAWYTTLAYSFQLYFDFTGYTDMAIGVALMFNIALPLNFNQPYRALDIREFWGRWHMTLSRFLRDYLYVPLGGNRHGEFRTYVNLMITFVLSGLWHGAGWTFVIWGAFHGIATAINRKWHRAGMRLPVPAAWLVTFGFVNITWVFFRAESMADATGLLQRMFGIGETCSLGLGPAWAAIRECVRFDTSDWIVAVVFLAMTPLVAPLIPKDAGGLKTVFRATPRFAIITVFVIVTSLMNFSKVSEFIYFNF